MTGWKPFDALLPPFSSLKRGWGKGVNNILTTEKGGFISTKGGGLCVAGEVGHPPPSISWARDSLKVFIHVYQELLLTAFWMIRFIIKIKTAFFTYSFIKISDKILCIVEKN